MTSKINANGTQYDIVTFAEALCRLGMDGRVADVDARMAETLVAYAPCVNADARTGRLFMSCSGHVLFSFCSVRKADHLPDEPWAWRQALPSIYVVVDYKETAIGDKGYVYREPFLKAVIPG